MNNLIINYVAPFMIASGGTTYVLSKLSEKKIINDFDNIKVGRASVNNFDKATPKELEKLVLTLENNVDKENLNNLHRNLENLKVNAILKCSY